MLKSWMHAVLATTLMLAPLAVAWGQSPYRSARHVGHMGGCDSCGCDVPCAAPCGDCCDPCCVPLIPAVLHGIDNALQRIFRCHCYTPCGCGLNCWDCAGCSGGCDGGYGAYGGGGGCSSCGGGGGPEVISGHLTPIPHGARRGVPTRGVSAGRTRKASAPTPAPRTTKAASAAPRVKTASTAEAQPITSTLADEVGSQVQRTSYSSTKRAKSSAPKNPLR